MSTPPTNRGSNTFTMLTVDSYCVIAIDQSIRSYVPACATMLSFLVSKNIPSTHLYASIIPMSGVTAMFNV
jgi:hypothetical protein